MNLASRPHFVLQHRLSPNPISCQMPTEMLYVGNKGSDGITEL